MMQRGFLTRNINRNKQMNTFRRLIFYCLPIVLGTLSINCSAGSGQRADADSALIDSAAPGNITENRRDSDLTIAMVGDIMMGTTYPKGGHNLTADDGASLFKDVKEIFQRVDITAGNLEGCLFDGEGKVKPCYNPKRFFAFKMPERYVKHLVDAGFDFVSVANNHINDFGPEALEATQRVLKEAGIAFAGVADKQPTTIVEKDGRKIGFAAFGFDPGMPRITDYETLRALVSGLKKECDIVVVSFHGGNEGEEYQHVPHKPEGSSRGDVEKFAHTAVEAGADVVYGHSPHVPRGLELYNDRIIFYSLGNFCTPYRFNLAEIRNYAPVAEVTLKPDGRFAKGKIHSFIQSSGVGPRKDTTLRVPRKMRDLTKADFPNTPIEITDQGDIVRKQ